MHTRSRASLTVLSWVFGLWTMIGAAAAAFGQEGPPARINLVDPGPVGAATTTGLFAQVAIGGGYSTTVTIINTGSDTLTGDLFLVADDGRPLSASLSSAGSLQGGSAQASSASLVVPAGGTQIITADPVSPSDPTRAGWASIISSGGAPNGVGTFRLSSGSGLDTVAGVLASKPVGVATIPVDDDTAADRITGYAISNPGTQAVNIKIVAVNADGSPFQTLNLPALNPLAPGAHLARFLYQDLGNPGFQFKGSMVLIAQGSGTFAVVALVQDHGLFTAIPVVAAKAPGVN